MEFLVMLSSMEFEELREEGRVFKPRTKLWGVRVKDNESGEERLADVEITRDALIKLHLTDKDFKELSEKGRISDRTEGEDLTVYLIVGDEADLLKRRLKVVP